MSRAKDERIRNSKIRKWFCDTEKMVDAWRRRQLLFLGRIVRLDKSACPSHVLMATKVGKRCVGRPSRTIRDSFVNNLKFVINNLDVRGSTHHWIGHAKNETDWINAVKRKENIERVNFRTGNNTQNDEEEDEPP